LGTGFYSLHSRRHPEAMGAEEVDAWLSYLANERQPWRSTPRNRAQRGGFIYIGIPWAATWVTAISKTSKGRRLPVVFSHEEAIARYIGASAMELINWLLALCRLRLASNGAVRLRVQRMSDLLEQLFGLWREAKGEKWRRTLLRILCWSPANTIDLALGV